MRPSGCCRGRRGCRSLETCDLGLCASPAPAATEEAGISLNVCASDVKAGQRVPRMGHTRLHSRRHEGTLDTARGGVGAPGDRLLALLTLPQARGFEHAP